MTDPWVLLPGKPRSPPEIIAKYVDLHGFMGEGVALKDIGNNLGQIHMLNDGGQCCYWGRTGVPLWDIVNCLLGHIHVWIFMEWR